MRTLMFVTTMGLAMLIPMMAEEGIAVYYAKYFQGKPTASKEKLDQEGLTAAHHRLPYGTHVKVTNLANNKSVVVKINDRMPPSNRHVIDVTRKAAEELDFVKSGSARVRVEVVK